MYWKEWNRDSEKHLSDIRKKHNDLQAVIDKEHEVFADLNLLNNTAVIINELIDIIDLYKDMRYLLKSVNLLQANDPHNKFINVTRRFVFMSLLTKCLERRICLELYIIEGRLTVGPLRIIAGSRRCVEWLFRGNKYLKKIS